MCEDPGGESAVTVTCEYQQEDYELSRFPRASAHERMMSPRALLKSRAERIKIVFSFLHHYELKQFIEPLNQERKQKTGNG